MVSRLQQGPRWLSRLQASTCPPMVTAVIDINTELGWDKATDPDMPPAASRAWIIIIVLGGSIGQSDLYGPSNRMALGHQHGLRSESPGICITFSGKRSHGH